MLMEELPYYLYFYYYVIAVVVMMFVFIDKIVVLILNVLINCMKFIINLRCLNP